LVVKAELFSGKRTGQRFRAQTQAGSNRIRHRASLHQAGQIAAFWRCPRCHKALQDFMSQPVQSCDSKFFAINNTNR
jgi:hypothetical protein